MDFSFNQHFFRKIISNPKYEFNKQIVFGGFGKYEK